MLAEGFSGWRTMDATLAWISGHGLGYSFFVPSIDQNYDFRSKRTDMHFTIKLLIQAISYPHLSRVFPFNGGLEASRLRKILNSA